MSTFSPSTSRLALCTLTASGCVKVLTASGPSSGDLVDGHHPGRLGVKQPDAGRDRLAGIPVDHGQRQPAPRGIGGGGHVEQLEQAEIGHPVLVEHAAVDTAPLPTRVAEGR